MNLSTAAAAMKTWAFIAVCILGALVAIYVGLA